MIFRSGKITSNNYYAASQEYESINDVHVHDIEIMGHIEIISNSILVEHIICTAVITSDSSGRRLYRLSSYCCIERNDAAASNLSARRAVGVV